MAKKQKKFKDWQDDEWSDSDSYDKKDGKRYNSKKESVKFQRQEKDRQKNSFFEPAP